MDGLNVGMQVMDGVSLKDRWSREVDVYFCAAHLCNSDLEKTSLEKLLVVNKQLRFYAEKLADVERGIHRKTLRNLLRVLIQLLYDYSQDEGFYRTVLGRSGDSKLSISDFFRKIKIEDVKEMLMLSKSSSHDYAKIVRMIGSLLY